MAPSTTLPYWERRMKKISGGLLLVLLLCACDRQPPEEALAMTDAELVELSAVEAVELIRSKQISATALVTAVLARAASHHSLNAFITLDETGALNQARLIDQRIQDGDTTGSLLGVPLAIKDNIEVAGLPNTAGTPALEGYVPQQHAPIIQALLDAGAIIIGKVNMHELAFGITSNNRHFGAVGNPYRPDHFPGGSSGGTATAVAGRMAVAGLGTDTGGSVRIPAAFTGIYGLRPSINRYSQQGITPITHSRDTAGPMTRTVSDLILLDAVITATTPDYTPADPKTLRLGVPRQYFYEDIDQGLVPVFEHALDMLKQAGITLVEADPGKMLDFLPGLAPLTMYEAGKLLPVYLEQNLHGEIGFAEFVNAIAGADVRQTFEMFIIGERYPSDEAYQTALQETLPAYRASVQQYFDSNDLDAMIFPTVAVTARPIAGSDQTIVVNGEPVPTFQTITRNSAPGSYAGIPGISLPIALDASGLPVGIEIDGPYRSDRRLLGIALLLESIFGHLPPP